jgi:hypothetical protein
MREEWVSVYIIEGVLTIVYGGLIHIVRGLIHIVYHGPAAVAAARHSHGIPCLLPPPPAGGSLEVDGARTHLIYSISYRV